MSYTAEEYAAAVWAHVPRTLGSGPSGVEHSPAAMAYAVAVWEYVVRTLTETPPAPSRRFVVPGAARRLTIPSLRRVEPERAEAVPGPSLTPAP